MDRQFEVRRESQTLPGFHSVTFFREVKERIAAETAGMTFEQLKKYIAERTAKGNPKQPSNPSAPTRFGISAK